jgi:hypothetical protein
LTFSWKWQDITPIVWPLGKPTPHPMFLHSKLKWRLFDDIWFNVAPIGQNQLRLIVYRLTMDFPKLKKKSFIQQDG